VTLKAGEFYFRASYDEETGRVTFDTEGCRVVRKGYAYMTPRIDGLTWGKRSKRNGDFGWLPGIPSWMRSRVKVDDRRYSQSKGPALRAALAAARAQRKFWAHDPAAVADYDKEIAAFDRALRRLTKA
jgi:hypothetical protein